MAVLSAYKRSGNGKSGRLERGTVLGPRGDIAASPSRKRKAALSAYAGAAYDRTLGDWSISYGSPDYDLLLDRMTLVRRSRERFRNDPLAKGALKKLLDEIIGTGIRCEANIQPSGSLTQEMADSNNATINTWWPEWIKEADYSGNAARRKNFYDLQSQVLSMVIQDGESIAIPRYVKRPGYRFSFCVQMVETDRVRTPGSTGFPSLGLFDGKVNMRDGIEIGKRGEEVAINIANTYPVDTNAYNPDETERIPATDRNGRANYWHIFAEARPGNTHGEPFFSSVLRGLKQLGGYIGAEIVRAEMAAFLGLWINTPEDPNSAAELHAEDYETNEDYPDSQKPVEWMEPGMIRYGRPGETVNTLAGNLPPSNFDAFVEKIATILGSPLGLTRELMLNSFDKSNFSNTRAALITAREAFKKLQLWLISQFIEPVYWRFLEELYFRNMLIIPAGMNFYDDRHIFGRMEAIPSGWPWIDPLKDIQAGAEAWQSRQRSLKDIYGAQGKSWQTELLQIAKEKQFMVANGIDITKVAPAAASDQNKSEEPNPDEQ